MPRIIPKEMHARANALNSTFRFSTQVVPVLEDDGKTQRHDHTKAPLSTKAVMAALVNKANGLQWITATGGTEEDAANNVLEKAKTAERPASTAKELAAQNSAMAQENARLQAELDRLRASNGAVRVCSEGSQVKRAAAVEPEPEPVVEPSAPVPEPVAETPAPPDAEGDDGGDKEQLRSLLRANGVQFHHKAGIEKLRTLAEPFIGGIPG